jgi:hypothetical protein
MWMKPAGGSMAKTSGSGAFTAFTLFHVDASRGGKVPLKLLGKALGGTVIADFYGAYDRLNGHKQRCLTHLLREIKDLSEEHHELCRLSAVAKTLALVPTGAAPQEALA